MCALCDDDKIALCGARDAFDDAEVASLHVNEGNVLVADLFSHCRHHSPLPYAVHSLFIVWIYELCMLIL